MSVARYAEPEWKERTSNDSAGLEQLEGTHESCGGQGMAWEPAYRSSNSIIRRQAFCGDDLGTITRRCIQISTEPYKNTSQLVKHPVLGRIQALQMLLWTARHIVRLPAHTNNGKGMIDVGSPNFEIPRRASVASSSLFRERRLTSCGRRSTNVSVAFMRGDHGSANFACAGAFDHFTQKPSASHILAWFLKRRCLPCLHSCLPVLYMQELPEPRLPPCDCPLKVP